MRFDKHEKLLAKTRKTADLLHVSLHIPQEEVAKLEITEAVHYCAMQLCAAWENAGNDHPNLIVEEKLRLMRDYQNWCYREFYNDTMPTENKVYSFKLFEEQAAKNPNKIAIDYSSNEVNVQLTYQQLNEQANQIAHTLIEHKTKLHWDTNKPIALLFNNSPDVVTMLLAIWKAGLIPMLLTFNNEERMNKMPAERLAYYLELATPSLLIVQDRQMSSDFIFMLRKKKTVANMLGFETLSLASQKKNKLNPNVINDAAYISFSSGSTGIPKQIKNFHFGLPEAIFKIDEITKHTDRVGWFSSLMFDACILDILTPLVLGKTLVPVPTKTRDNIALLEEYLKIKRVSLITLPPSVVEKLDPEALNEIHIIVTGENPAEHILKAWPQRIYNGYGPNENSVCTTVVPYVAEDGVHIGDKPVSGEWFCLTASSEDNPFPTRPTICLEDKGELYIGGKGLGEYIESKGQQQEESWCFRAIIHPDQKIKKLIWVLQSRDIVEWTLAKNLRYVSRSNDQCKINGVLVHPGAIERAMLSFTINNQVVFSKVAVIYDHNTKIMTAYCTPNLKITPSISRSLHHYLAHHKFCNVAPHQYVIVQADQWPVSERGKLQKKALTTQSGDIVYVSDALKLKEFINNKALNSIAEIIYPIWYEVLNINKAERDIFLDDNFYELGGDSIDAYLMITKLKNQLPAAATAALNIATFSRAATIRNLVNFCAYHMGNREAIDIVRQSNSQRLTTASSPVILISSITGDSTNEFRHVINCWNSFFPDRTLITTRLTGTLKYEMGSITELAGLYVQSLRKKCDLSRAILLSYSGGGVLATEIAHQLQMQGVHCGVVCVDTRSEQFYQKLSQAEHAVEVSRLIKHLATQLGFKADYQFNKLIESANLADHIKQEQVPRAWSCLKEHLQTKTDQQKEFALDAYVMLYNITQGYLSHQPSNFNKVSLISFSDTAHQCRLTNNNTEDPYLGFNPKSIARQTSVQGLHLKFVNDDTWVKKVIIPIIENEFELLDTDLLKSQKKSLLNFKIASLRKMYCDLNQDDILPVQLSSQTEKFLQDIPSLLASAKSVSSLRANILSHNSMGKTTALKKIAQLLSENDSEAIAFYIPLKKMLNRQIDFGTITGLAKKMAHFIHQCVSDEFIDFPIKDIHEDDIADMLVQLPTQCWFLIDDLHKLSKLPQAMQEVVSNILERNNVIATAHIGYHSMAYNAKQYYLDEMQPQYQLQLVERRIAALSPCAEVQNYITTLYHNDPIIHDLIDQPLCINTVIKFISANQNSLPQLALIHLLDNIALSLINEFKLDNEFNITAQELNTSAEHVLVFLKMLAFNAEMNGIKQFTLEGFKLLWETINCNAFAEKSPLSFIENSKALRLIKANDQKHKWQVEFLTPALKDYFAASYIKQLILNPDFSKDDNAILDDYLKRKHNKPEQSILALVCNMLELEGNASESIQNAIAQKRSMAKKENENKNLAILLNTQVMKECMTKENESEIEELLQSTSPDRKEKLVTLVKKIVGARENELKNELKIINSLLDLKSIVHLIYTFKPSISIVNFINDHPKEFVGKNLKIRYNILKFDFESNIVSCTKQSPHQLRFKLGDGKAVEINRNTLTGNIANVIVEWFETTTLGQVLKIGFPCLIDIPADDSAKPIINEGRYYFEAVLPESGVFNYAFNYASYKITGKEKLTYILKRANTKTNSNYLITLTYKNSKITEAHLQIDGDSNQTLSVAVDPTSLLLTPAIKVVREMIPGLDHSVAESCIKIEKMQPDPLQLKMQILREVENLKKALVDNFITDDSSMMLSLIDHYINNGRNEVDVDTLQNDKIKKQIDAIVDKMKKIDTPITSNTLLTELIRSSLYCSLVNKRDSYVTANIMGLLSDALKNTHKIATKSIIAVVGDTGVGKSTLLTGLMGVPLKQSTNTFGRKIIDIDEEEMKDIDLQGVVIPKIGHLLSVSDTNCSDCYSILPIFKSELIKLLSIEILKAYLVDSIGHRDTRGAFHDMAGALSFDRMIKNAGKLRALVLMIPFESFFIGRGELIINAFENLRERFPNLYDLDQFFKLGQSIFIAVTKLPEHSHDNDQRIKKCIEEFMHNCKGEIINQERLGDKNRLAHELFKMKICQFLSKLYDNDQVILSDPTVRIDNFNFLTKLMRAPGIDKSEYNYALSRMNIANLFTKTIHMTLHTWRECIMRPYLEDLPNSIEDYKKKIKDAFKEVTMMIDSTLDKKVYLLSNYEYMVGLAKEIKELHAYKNDQKNILEKEAVLKKLSKRASNLHSGQVQALKKIIEEIKSKIAKAEKHMKKCIFAKKHKLKEIEVITENIKELHDEIEEKSSTVITENLGGYKKNNPEDIYHFTYLKDGVKNEIFKNVRDARPDEKYTTDQRVKYGELKTNMNVQIVIKKDFVLVPIDPAKKAAFLAHGHNGEFVATVSGEGWEFDLGRNATSDSKSIIYSFTLKFDGDRNKLPWVTITHTIPGKERYASDIINLETDIKTRTEKLNSRKTELAGLDAEIEFLNRNIQEYENEIQLKEDEIKALETKMLISQVDELIAHTQETLAKKQIELYQEIDFFKKTYGIIETHFDTIEKCHIPKILKLLQQKRYFALTIQDQHKLADLTRNFADLALNDYKDISLLKDKHGDITAECQDFITYYDNNRSTMLAQSAMDIDISLNDVSKVPGDIHADFEKIRAHLAYAKNAVEPELAEIFAELNTLMRSKDLESQDLDRLAESPEVKKPEPAPQKTTGVAKPMPVVQKKGPTKPKAVAQRTGTDDLKTAPLKTTDTVRPKTAPGSAKPAAKVKQTNALATFFAQIKLAGAKPTLGDGSCFFHGSFGENTQGRYATPHASAMRAAWAKFLGRFDSCADIRMPQYIKNAMNKVLQFHLENGDLDHINDNVRIFREDIKRQIAYANDTTRNMTEELVNNIINNGDMNVRNINLVKAAITQIADNTKYSRIKSKLLERMNIERGELAALSMENLVVRLSDIIAELRDPIITLNSFITDMVHNEIASHLAILQNISVEEARNLYTAGTIASRYINSPQVYQAYLLAIQQHQYFVYIEEIPIIATLSQQTIIVHFSEEIKRPFVPSDQEDPAVSLQFWTWPQSENQTSIYLQGEHYSKYIPETSASSDNTAANAI